MKTLEPIVKDAVYKTNEAADALRVDRTYIYKAYNAGELKGKQMGKGLRFLGSDLLNYAGTATPPQNTKTTIDSKID